MKLQSIQKHSDYLKNDGTLNDAEKWKLHIKRVEFGKQQISIEKIVPCKLVDGVWFFLEEPVYPFRNDNDYQNTVIYNEAKEKVLFDGFEVKERKSNGMTFKYIEKGKLIIYYFNRGFNRFEKHIKSETIEDLVKYNLELTETAKKQIGL